MTIYFQSTGTNNVHQCVRLFGLVLTGSNAYPSCYLPLSRQPAHNDGLPARSSVIFRISTVDSARAVDLFRRRERRFGFGFCPHLRRICFFRQREDPRIRFFGCSSERSRSQSIDSLYSVSRPSETYD